VGVAELATMSIDPLQRARELRGNLSPPEQRLWAILYQFRRQGFHFRRQVPIGPFFADFACHHARLVIEADGATHGSDEGEARDTARDAFIERRGYRILRFWNNDIMSNDEGVYQRVAKALEGCEPMPVGPRVRRERKPRRKSSSEQGG
jgi:very-short-patch-repair endonuclease